MITLYGEKFWYSPYVFSVFVALKEKGIPFETKILDLDAGEQSSPSYRAASLTGRVPSIEHEGFVLSESTAIIEYLEEAFPAPKWPRLLPESLADRARARQIMGWLRSDLMPLREERSTETMFYAHAKEPLSGKAAASAERLFFVVDRAVGAGNASLFDTFSIADADLAFMVHRLLVNGDQVPEKTRRFAEAQWRRPSVREYVDRTRPPR
jgi:glutathione S-transferase